MIPDQLPVLQVIIPLLAAPVCVLLGGSVLSRAVAQLVGLATFLISLGIVGAVQESGLIVTEIGGWPPPWGIAYQADALTALIGLLISATAFGVLWFAPASFRSELESNKQGLYYAAFLLCLSGLLGIVMTQDAFNLFVFLEISSLSSYALIGMGKNPRCLTASFRYLITGTIGATFILIGVGLLYLVTGTLNMVDLAQRLPEVEASRALYASLAFLTVGFALKMALFPLHQWLPDAYAFAPSAASAFLAAAATKASIYAAYRFYFDIFGATPSLEAGLGLVLLPLVLFGLFIPSAIAIGQTEVKRMLAYSSVAQIGYMVLGLALATEAWMQASLLHLFNHGLMKAALFLALGCVVYRLGGSRLSDLAGLAGRMPLTAAVLLVGGLSLIGVPGTSGFVSKWLMVEAAIGQGSALLAIAVLASSLLTIAYVWRMVDAIYFQPVGDSRSGIVEAPWSMLIPTLALGLANIAFGLFPGLLLDLSADAAALLRVNP